jgi:DinB superfamily
MNTTTLNALVVFPQQLEAYYGAIPVAFKQWVPPSWDGVPSEPFSAIEQICHVRDIEVDGYHVRFHRVLAEDKPTLASVDGEALAKARSYATANAGEVFAAFRQARAQTITLLSTLTSVQLDRTADFAGYGTVSLRSLMHYLCSHDQQHLAGLQWLLGKIEASRAHEKLGDQD